MEPLIDETTHVEDLPAPYGVPGFLISSIDRHVSVQGVHITCGIVIYETDRIMEAVPSICIWTKKKPVKLRVVK